MSETAVFVATDGRFVASELARGPWDPNAQHGGAPAALLMRAFERLDAGDFYILCPDNDVPRSLDERRILWGAGDIVENRPALSRWHPDYAAAFAAFVKDS